MTKSYYFQHDYNAHTDIKLLFVRQKLGMEGYGIYWYIVEQLAISGGKMPLKIIPILSMQIQTPEAKVEAVIKHFDLFQIIEDEFFSIRLMEQLSFRNSLSNAGRKGALLRWGDRGANGEAINTPNAKERKGKERKDKINNPDEDSVIKENINMNQEAAASRTQRSDFISLPDGKVIFEYESSIPESRLTGVIKYLKTIHGFDVSKERVLDFWNIFRDLQIDAGKGYDRPEDGYTHFFNWAAGRPLPKEKRAYAASVSKSVNGSKKKEDVVGVEFINDFTECRMSDGTVKKLNQNQSDQARYKQINPKAIK